MSVPCSPTNSKELRRGAFMSTGNTRNRMSRRAFLQAAGAASAVLLLPACAAPAAPSAAPAAGGDAATPSAEKIAIVATTQMNMTQWEPATQRALEELPDI